MRNLLLLSTMLLLFSCNNDDYNNEVAESDTTFITVESAKPTIENPAEFKNLVWLPVFDSAKGDFVIKQQRMVKADTLTADKLIREINASWEGIKLEMIKISNDTIYVAVPESTKLTQQMGSSGANSYMYSTTYILTELKNVRFVHFDFIEGDHLAPGTYKRSDFTN